MERSAIQGSVWPLIEADDWGLRGAAPVLGQQALPHIMMEGRIRPMPNLSDQPVLDRIVMDVINVAAKISIVADSVLPESSLP